jgi:putative ABC transport system permease protein
MEVDLFIPMVMDREQLQRGSHSNLTIARVADGYTLDQVQADMASIIAGLSAEYPEEMANLGAYVLPVRRQSVELVRTTIMLLLVAVGLVLLIACANVANLLLARAGARRREIAVRIAVGADRPRLIRQLLTESLLLAGMGGVLGLLLAVWGTAALRQANPLQLPSMYAPRLEPAVLLFTITVVVVTSVLFGLIPALQHSRTDLRSALQQGARAGSSRSQNRAKRFLVMAESALAVLVLIGAGLTLRSFSALENADAGFLREGIQTFEVTLPGIRYPEPDQRAAFFASLTDRLAAIPGVERVSSTNALPLNFDINGSGYYLEGDPVPTPGEWQIGMRRWVVPGYFTTLGIPVVRGRDFTAEDGPESEPVVIVNQAFARRHAVDGEVIGRRLTWDDPNEDEELTFARIVGVVGDTRYLGLDQPDDPAVYSPYAGLRSGYMMFALRSNRTTAELAPGIRSAVWALDDRLPPPDVVSMEERVATSLEEPRHASLLLALFGGVALLLAAVGLYGVVSYTVGESLREMGIRVAFGARPEQILLRVLRGGLGMVVLGAGLGIAAGLIGSLSLVRYLRETLYGVSVVDPVTYAVVPVVLILVATAAALVPAWRAMRLSPMEILRYE